MHRCMKTYRNGLTLQEPFYDVRTVLLADEIGPARCDLLEQGEIAAGVVLEWLKDADVDERELAERIPALPRREDSFPLRAREPVR